MSFATQTTSESIENISPSEWLTRAVLEDRRVFPSKIAAQDQSRKATGIKTLSTEIYDGLEDDPGILIASLGTEGAPDAIGPRADFPDAHSLERHVRSVTAPLGTAQEVGDLLESSVYPILHAILKAEDGGATLTPRTFKRGNRVIETNDIAAWNPKGDRRFDIELKNRWRYMETPDGDTLKALRRAGGARPIIVAPAFWPEYEESLFWKNFTDTILLPSGIYLARPKAVEALRLARFASVPAFAPNEITPEGVPAKVAIAWMLAEVVLGHVPEIEVPEVEALPSARSRDDEEALRLSGDGKARRLVEAAVATGADTRSEAAKEIGKSVSTLRRAEARCPEIETRWGLNHGGDRVGSGRRMAGHVA